MYEKQMFANLKPKVTIKYNDVENIKAFKNVDSTEEMISDGIIRITEFTTFIFDKSVLTSNIEIGDIVTIEEDSYIVRKFKKYGIDGTFVRVFCTTE